MEKPGWLLGDQPNPLGDRLDEIRERLRRAHPESLATRTGAIYTPADASHGNFRLYLWGQEILVHFPDFTAEIAESGTPLNTFDLTMLAYYFDISDGRPMSGEWVAFNQLPDGMFYAQAFQGYTGEELAKVFGNDADAFMEANLALEGRREFFGNLAFSYQPLPRVMLMVVCWLGDDEFPPSYRLLFDSSVSHHLTTDACAILGSNLVRRLIKQKPA